MSKFFTRFIMVGLGALSLILMSASVSDVSPARAQSPVQLVVNRRVDLGSGRALDDFIRVQGAPMDYNDPFEQQAWRALGLRTSSMPLLNDEFYFPEGGLHVIRSTAPPTDECSGGARGPLGPQKDLWLCADEFKAHLARWQAALGADFHQIVSLIMMPRTLSFNPKSEHWMVMSPRDPEEWTAVMRETGRYLAELGWDEPLIMFFNEYENLFRGQDRPLYDGTFETAQARAEDYAALYIATQNALQEHVPNVKLVGAITGTYSRDITRDLQQNPEALGIEDWLEATKRLDASFEPSAVGWQGYYWYGLDGFGPGRLLEGAEHVRGVLRNLGYREDIPQHLDGWNSTFGNFEAVDGSISAEARLMNEAAHQASSIVDLLELDVNAPRRIASAFYYTWNLDEKPTPDYVCGFPYQSLVSTVHDGMDLGDPNGCNIPASKIECTRAPYHALKFLSGLRGGNFVGAQFQGDDGADLRALAVKKNRATEIVVVDRNGAALPAFDLALQGLAARTRYTFTFTTIQPTENLCADVSSQTRRARSDRNGRLVLPLAATGDAILHIRVQAR